MREIVVAVVGCDIVWARHLRAAAQSIVAEAEVSRGERARRRQRLQAVERVIRIRGRSAFWVRETRAVRCFVVCVARGEIPRQERIAGGDPTGTYSFTFEHMGR